MPVPPYDIIILGAGPAGAACALALKKSGLRTLLIDRSDFPRDKTCGDAVHSVTKRILRGIDPELEADFMRIEPRADIRRWSVYAPDQASVTLQFRSSSQCIRRVDLDAWLFRKATEGHPTLEVRTGETVRSIAREGERIVVRTEQGAAYEGRILIACDGANSVAGRTLAGFTIDRQHHSAALRQYYRNIGGMNADTSEIHFVDGHLPGYFWIFPVGDGVANVGFGMLSSVIAAKRIDLRRSMASIIRESPGIAERFRTAEPLEEPKGFGLPMGSVRRPLSGDGFMLCGDAASLIDPFSGEGIAPAMESGVIAASVAVEAFASQRFDAEFLQRYHDRIQARFHATFRNNYLLQRTVAHRPWLINTLVHIGRTPFINRRLVHWLFPPSAPVL